MHPIAAQILDEELAELGGSVEQFVKVCDEILDSGAGGERRAAVLDTLRRMLTFDDFNAFHSMMSERHEELEAARRDAGKWAMALDLESGCAFFYHVESMATQWDPPEVRAAPPRRTPSPKAHSLASLRPQGFDFDRALASPVPTTRGGASADEDGAEDEGGGREAGEGSPVHVPVSLATAAGGGGSDSARDVESGRQIAAAGHEALEAALKVAQWQLQVATASAVLRAHSWREPRLPVSEALLRWAQATTETADILRESGVGSAEEEGGEGNSAHALSRLRGVLDADQETVERDLDEFTRAQAAEVERELSPGERKARLAQQAAEARRAARAQRRVWEQSAQSAGLSSQAAGVLETLVRSMVEEEEEEEGGDVEEGRGRDDEEVGGAGAGEENKGENKKEEEQGVWLGDHSSSSRSAARQGRILSHLAGSVGLHAVAVLPELLSLVESERKATAATRLLQWAVESGGRPYTVVGSTAQGSGEEDVESEVLRSRQLYAPPPQRWPEGVEEALEEAEEAVEAAERRARTWRTRFRREWGIEEAGDEGVSGTQGRSSGRDDDSIARAAAEVHAEGKEDEERMRRRVAEEAARQRRSMVANLARRRRGARAAALVHARRAEGGSPVGQLADRTARLSARLEAGDRDVESGEVGEGEDEEQPRVQTAALSGLRPAVPPPLHWPQQGTLPPLRLAPLRALQRPVPPSARLEGPDARGGAAAESEGEAKGGEAMGRAHVWRAPARPLPDPFRSSNVRFAGGGGGVSSGRAWDGSSSATAPDVPLLSSAALSRAGRTLEAAASAQGGTGSWSDDFDAPAVADSNMRGY